MIEFKEVSLHFGAQEILRRVSLRIGAGERVGVIGPNGAGKSTLFGLMTGDLTPYRGTVSLPRDCRLGHVRQQLPADVAGMALLDFTMAGMADLRVIESRLHGLTQALALPDKDPAQRQRHLSELGELETRFDHLGGYALRSRAEAVLCGLGFHPEQMPEALAVLSGGWRMRAELARALVAQPDLLLLDEPSNYLDVPAVEWLQRYLRDFTGTLLLISHDRFLLQSLTTITVHVARGEVTRYEGGTAVALAERRQRELQQSAAARNQDRKRQQIERFVERFRAKNTKATQVQSRIKALERMETMAPPPPAVSTAAIRLPVPPPCGHDILRLEGVGLTYDGQRWIFRDVDLQVQRGERIALIGYNGMGKTSLLRVMAGARVPSAGRRILGHKVRIGYQSQEFSETISPQHTLLEVVRQQNPDRPQADGRAILGAFGFSGAAVKKTAGVLSGGEKIRLVFARLFADPPNCLLLDEPTTHLDMDGRESLEQALYDYPGAMCFVSHDIAFVRRLATGILAVSEHGVERFAGGYDDYRERHASATAIPAATLKAAAGPTAAVRAGPAVQQRERRRERARNRRETQILTRDWQRTVAAAEQAIAALEVEQQIILDRLAGADAATDYAACNRRLKEIGLAIETQTVRWEQAAEALELIRTEAAEGPCPPP